MFDIEYTTQDAEVAKAWERFQRAGETFKAAATKLAIGVSVARKHNIDLNGDEKVNRLIDAYDIAYAAVTAAQDDYEAAQR